MGFGRFGLGFGGLGFGWGAPWRWGLGPWGMGWGGLPIVPPVLPVAPAVAAIGKRAVDSVVPTGLVVPQINNGTVCTYAEKKSMLSCLGNTFNFECEVSPINLAGISPIRVENLTVVLDERVIDGIHFPVFRLFSRVGHVLNNFSLLNKEDKKVVLSVFNQERLVKHETGIRVKDTECWTAFIRMVREVVPSTIDFDFVESHISTVTTPATPRV